MMRGAIIDEKGVSFMRNYCSQGKHNLHITYNTFSVLLITQL